MVDTETHVREATHRLQTNNDSIITIGLPTDALEHEAVSQFMTSGCGCTKAKGKPCCEHFSQEYVTSMRQSCAELTHTEQDMTILGQIAACSNISSRVSSRMLSTGRGRHKEADREKGYALMAMPADSPTMLSPSLPRNSLCASCSIMPNSMLYFCQEEFLNTTVLTFNFFHLAYPSKPSGEHTTVQLKQAVPSILWPTAHFAITGGS